MTGPEHYQYAETMLGEAAGDDAGTDVERFHLAVAQVHATLAVAAATALTVGAEIPVHDDPVYRSWWEVAS